MLRFLELNPDQVIVLFDEDYVAERDLKGAFNAPACFVASPHWCMESR